MNNVLKYAIILSQYRADSKYLTDNYFNFGGGLSRLAYINKRVILFAKQLRYECAKCRPIF